MFEPAVVGFYPIVGIPLDMVPGRWDQLVKDLRVDGRRVSHDLGRCHLQRADGAVEEAAGRLAVAALGDQDVDDLPVLVNCPVDVAPDAVDLMSAAGSTFGQTRVG